MKKTLFLFGFLLPFLGVAIAVLHVNPYCVLTCKDWMTYVPDGSEMERTTLAYVAEHVKARAITLGNSRATTFDMHHPGWHSSPVLKLSIRRLSVYEAEKYFEHVQAIQPLDQAIIITDYLTWDGLARGSFSEDRLWHTTKPNNTLLLYFRSVEDFYTELFSSYSFALTTKSLFPSIWQFYVEHSFQNYKPPPSAEHIELKGDPLESMRTIINFASVHNIDSAFIIPPIPNYRLPALVSPEKHFQWERDLVALLDEAAAKYGKRFPLWDFSDFNTITTTPLNPSSSDVPSNEWFWDRAHFNKNVATMILNRVFNVCTEYCDIPKDFGVQLTKDNIEQHIEKMQTDAEKYRKEHPDLKL